MIGLAVERSTEARSAEARPFMNDGPRCVGAPRLGFNGHRPPDNAEANVGTGLVGSKCANGTSLSFESMGLPQPLVMSFTGCMSVTSSIKR